MILAGDIGGTKTNLALVKQTERGDVFTHISTFRSQVYPDLASVILEFLEQMRVAPSSLNAACFAVAGPIVEGVGRATNLHWQLNTLELREKLGIVNLHLLNDLEANAWALDVLAPADLYEMHSGKDTMSGNRAVVSPGTGLGEAGLYWDGERHRPFACEGGHCEFGPKNGLQNALLLYLQEKFGHVSYERILSGPGLQNIYHFLKEKMAREEPGELGLELSQEDPAKVITRNALSGRFAICSEALDLFVSILGSETGNCALKFMATGGVFLGGGIPPKILPKLKEALFFEAFTDKGRFKEFLERIPIYVILDDKASLKGAAHYCRLRMHHSHLFVH